MQLAARFGPVFRDAVRGSPDLDRVLSIARRPPVDLSPGSVRAEALVELMTSRLRRPVQKCVCASELGRRCLDRLLPAQAWALYEAPLAGGLLAPLGVGSGKTILNLLMPLVMRAKVAVLFVPPGLVEQLSREYLAVREHFFVPSIVFPLGKEGYIVDGAPVVHVIPYSRFSRHESTDLLERFDPPPDLVIADEAHLLKNRKATRTGRVLRHFANHPSVRLCAWSGTITSKSILDFAHLSAFALGESSPLPLDPSEVERWAAALDPSDWPAPAGALRALAAPGEGAVSSMHRRLVETRGVVATRATNSCAASLEMLERSPPPVPEKLSALISALRKTWQRPDGEELVDALAVSACARQLACGFYYRWRFPGKPKESLVSAWFAARKAWGRELRERLKRPQPHLDSPLLLANAAQRHSEGYAGELPTWSSKAWAPWRDVKDSVQHETETVWVDDYLARDAVEWARANRGVVWYEHAAFGRKVAERAGLPLHGGGVGAEAEILAERGDRSVIASIKSHGTGRDGLQRMFCVQLVANPPAGGEAWEQLLGRLHRVGQEADTVTTHVYRHTEEMADSVDKAVRLAKYIEGITGTNQKLLATDVNWAL